MVNLQALKVLVVRRSSNVCISQASMRKNRQFAQVKLTIFGTINTSFKANFKTKAISVFYLSYA